MAATLNSILPASGNPGDLVTLDGTGFVIGAVVVFTNPGATTINAKKVTFVDANTITCVVPEFDGIAEVLSVVVANPSEANSNAVNFALNEYPVITTQRPLVGLQALKDGLEMIDGSDAATDAHLRELIRAASAQIEGYCGREFRREVFADELYDGDGSSTLFLRSTPVLSVSAVSIDDVAVDLAEIKTYPRLIGFEDSYEYVARLRSFRRLFPCGRQNVKVSYAVGYDEVPSDIAQACVLQVAYLKNTSNKRGIESDTFQDAGVTTSWSHRELDPAVKSICSRYRATRMAVV